MWIRSVVTYSLVSVTIVPAIIAASVSLVVSVVAAVLTPAVTSLRDRREAINMKFDAALQSLLLAQAARHIPSSIQRHYHRGDDEEFRLFTVRMSENSILRFIAETTQARAALAAISPYVPEAREWIKGRWELTEEQEPHQREVIERCRASALKSERLFRQRQWGTGRH